LTAVFQAGHVCGDSVDLIDGKPTGSVRISFGFSSTLDDAQQFLRFVYTCFLDNADDTLSAVADSMSGSVADSVSHCVSKDASAAVYDGHYQCLADKMKLTTADNHCSDDNNEEMYKDIVSRLPMQLDKIFVYPVKSCAAVQVNKQLTLTCIVFTCQSDKQSLIDVWELTACQTVM